MMKPKMQDINIKQCNTENDRTETHFQGVNLYVAQLVREYIWYRRNYDENRTVLVAGYTPVSIITLQSLTLSRAHTIQFQERS